MSSASLAATPAPAVAHLERAQLAAALLAAGAAVLYALLLALIVTSGVDPQWFERVHDPAVYAGALRAGDGSLRLILGIDTVFIACYAGATAALMPALRAHLGALWPALLAGCGLVAGALDLVENQHILAMLVGTGHGALPSAGELDLQMVASSCKWLLGHIGFAWMAVALAPTRGLARPAVIAVGVFQLVVGTATWMAPDGIQPVFAIARAVSLLAGFAIISLSARALLARQAS